MHTQGSEAGEQSLRRGSGAIAKHVCFPIAITITITITILLLLYYYVLFTQRSSGCPRRRRGSGAIAKHVISRAYII